MTARSDDLKRNVEDVIRAVVKQQLEGVNISKISLSFDTDEDGDDIVWVKVIFDDRSKPLDSHRTLGLVRHLRPRMAELGETAFPVLSYIAKSELGRNSPEAA